MEIPEAFFHKGIDEDNGHDKPGKLCYTVRIGCTDDDNPEGITNQVNIKEPGIILILIFTYVNKIVGNTYCHSTI